MPGTLFFVHGTGVRDAAYRDTLERIKVGCQKQPRLRDVDIAEDVSWGEELGTATERIGLALPPEERNRVLETAELDQGDEQIFLWSLLLDDPLFELRIASQQPSRVFSAIGNQAPDAAIVASLIKFATESPPQAHGISSDRLSAAARWLAQSKELPEAANAAGSAEDAELIDALARAIVAHALRPADNLETRPAAAFNAAARDEVVSVVARMLTTDTRGVRSWLKDRVGDMVKGLATPFLRDRRQSLTGGALPAVGDIFLHLRRGSHLLDFLTAKMTACRPPIVTIGHSLGGVMLVDLLSRPHHPDAARLITVGSQAPLFYAVDALENLRPDNSSVRPFVPWLNIYDRSDFLSFVAVDIFGPNSRIKDVEIRSGVPFPDSHSAYWDQDRTYELIANEWP